MCSIIIKNNPKKFKLQQEELAGSQHSLNSHFFGFFFFLSMSWSQFNTFQTKNYRSDLPSMCRVVSSLLLVVSEREKSLIKCEKGIFSLFDLNSTNQEPIECIPIKDLVKYQAHFTQFFLCNKEPTKILCLWIHQIGLFWIFFPQSQNWTEQLHGRIMS